MKVALVHDWLNGMRGGEKVLEQVGLLYPEADIFTLLYEPGKVSEGLRSHKVKSSFVQGLPFHESKYRWYLPLFPMAIESFSLKGYDLVISSSHCVALGVRAPKGVPHICYCHTPMRYAYEHFDTYFPRDRYNPLLRGTISWFMEGLRKWDRKASARPSLFIANSMAVAGRIREHYGRDSLVIHPPVDTDFFTPGTSKEDFYLAVSALVPYKRLDIAVRAFSAAEKPLIVIGEGPEKARLQALAGKTVRFMGWESSETIREHYRRARAFIFPGEEDFGITPLEAAACGTPTIAFGRGGAMETVVDGVNGVLFPEQTEESLLAAVDACRGSDFSRGSMRDHAMRFSPDKFRRQFGAAVEKAVKGAKGA